MAPFHSGRETESNGPPFEGPKNEVLRYYLFIYFDIGENRIDVFAEGSHFHPSIGQHQFAPFRARHFCLKICEKSVRFVL